MERKTLVIMEEKGWLLERLKSELKKEHSQYFTEVYTPDLVGIKAFWHIHGITYFKRYYDYPENQLKEFVCGYKQELSPAQANIITTTTIHHIVPEKFDLKLFLIADQFIDHYHVPCQRTYEQIRNYTKKPITVLPFWVNDKIYYSIDDKDFLRKKWGFDKDKYLIGSFQRDTEGYDLQTPKLEKGPDIFCDYVEKAHKDNPNLEVVLAGYRRQYIIKRLTEANIKFHYFEMCDTNSLNELYNCLDLYVISSRYEGGPQAAVEAAITKTPIISTDVGFVGDYLAPESIAKDGDLFSTKPNTEYAYEKVQKLKMKNHMQNFVDFFQKLQPL